MNRNLVLLVLPFTAVAAAAQEIGYIETFSLADDREAALRELVPGTDDFFFYTALHAQNTGQRERFQRTLDAWARARNGQVVPAARELLNRQALLDYGRDPQATLKYLREQLRLNFSHTRRTPEQRADLPTRLDPARIAFDTVAAERLKNSPRSLEPFSDVGLFRLAGRELTPEQRRDFLRRATRPDIPGLVDMILADLAVQDSPPFGHLPIHRQLTLAQLDDLAQKRPALRNEAAFVSAYLARLVPDNETDLATEAPAREAYYERVWAFVSQLDDAHNTLKANVLYNRLLHDTRVGVRNRARFIEYLKLPRRVPYVARPLLESVARPEHLADLAADPKLIALPPISMDEPLVRDYLLYFLRDAADYSEFQTWIRDDYLKKVFAESKIVHGIGEPSQWANLLTPDEYRALRERVDLEFLPHNPDVLRPEDPVRLSLWVKNVEDLQINIYEIDTFNYYRDTGRSLNLAINLDGLVPTDQQRHRLQAPAEQRIQRTFEFPNLTGRGVWVIEFIGNGRSSRALVQKGRLGAVQSMTAAGQALTVFDESNRRLPDARAWIGGREFAAGPDGRIVIPFTTEPKTENVILRAGSFASLTQIRHEAEVYELAANMHLDRESLLPEATARLLLRPILRINGHPVDLKLLEQPRLVLTVTDIRGISTEREYPGLTLTDREETVVEFAVPEQIVAVTARLEGRVRNVSRRRHDDLSATGVWRVNQMHTTLATRCLHALLTPEGYVVELRGKNGEPVAGATVAGAFYHRDFQQPIHVQLRTDEHGRVALGPLTDIVRFSLTPEPRPVDWPTDGPPNPKSAEWRAAHAPPGVERTWTVLRSDCWWPSALHGPAGRPLRLPLPDPSIRDPKHDFSLLEVRGGVFVRDCADRMSVTDGDLELRDLEPGDYSLQIRSRGVEIPVRVTRGEPIDHIVVSSRRALERPRLEPLQIAAIEPGPDTVVVRLRHAGPFARVHVYGLRYLPPADPADVLAPAGWPSLVEQRWTLPQTFYESGRKVGDEYRYILDRRTAQKYPAVILERPGLLLNPWVLRETRPESEVLQAGTAYVGRQAAHGAVAAVEGAALGVAVPVADFPTLDFLATPSAVLPNLRPDADGRIVIPRAQLGHAAFLVAVALDPCHAVRATAALGDPKPALRNLRLAAPLDPNRPFAEVKTAVALAAGRTLEIPDASMARMEIVDTVARAWQLLSTLATNQPALRDFSFIPRWASLPATEKLDLYSKFACHELNFFLFRKDPVFFKEVVAPYLANKRDKTFLDCWLLGENPDIWLEPWEYRQLNVVEKILLAQRLPDRREAIVRDIRDQADLLPTDVVEFHRLFDTALQAGVLEGGETLRGLAATAEPAAPQVSALALRAGGGAPSSAAAPSPAAAFEAAANALAAPPPDQEKMDRAAKQRRQNVDGTLPPADKDAGDFLTDVDISERRAASRPFFRAPDMPRELAENNYYKLPIAQQTATLVRPSPFWADYAAHAGSESFLSTNFLSAHRNFTEIIFAVAALDLPFEAAPHKVVSRPPSVSIEAAGPMLLFLRQVAPAAAAERAGSVLVAQNFFRADDPWLYEGNERYERYVTGDFQPGVPYGARVVLTNPTGNRQYVQVLLQIPQGSVPLQSGLPTRGVHLALEPYETRTMEYYFYFPETGEFTHHPAALAQGGVATSRALPTFFRVVSRPERQDTTSWAWISQNSTPDQVLAFLRDANLHRITLSEIAWRCRERDFYVRAIELLEDRRAFDPTLWSYAILHNDPPRIRAFLAHSPLATACGPVLDSPLLTLDPVRRRTYQHLEYDPMIVPRAHPVGGRHRIHNAEFRHQYHEFLRVLAYKASLNPEDHLAVAYYLALQDRVEDALKWFGRVERNNIAEKIQYDYLRCHLALRQRDIATARTTAAAYRDHPVPRWRARFAAVLAQLDEIRGAPAARPDTVDSAPLQQDALASTEPVIEIHVEAGRVRIDYRNLQSCVLNFYPTDIEFLFSRNPFLQDTADTFVYVRPAFTRTVDLPAGRTTITVDLPEDLKKNLIVEAVADNLRRTQAYYPNTLRVHLIEAFGQLLVTHADTLAPIPGAYVKVYARLPNKQVKFYKDGYTDLRGRFDYASIQDPTLARAERLAVLVLSEDLGAVIREVTPPKK